MPPPRVSISCSLTCPTLPPRSSIHPCTPANHTRFPSLVGSTYFFSFLLFFILSASPLPLPLHPNHPLTVWQYYTFFFLQVYTCSCCSRLSLFSRLCFVFILSLPRSSSLSFILSLLSSFPFRLPISTSSQCEIGLPRQYKNSCFTQHPYTFFFLSVFTLHECCSEKVRMGGSKKFQAFKVRYSVLSVRCDEQTRQ